MSHDVSSFRRRPYAWIALFCILLLGVNACNNTSTEEPAKHVFPVNLDLTDLLPDVPLDSMFIEVKIGNNDFQPLLVDLKSGESRTRLSAKPGDSILVRFELYSGKTRIGQGTLKGSLTENSTASLEPIYDSTAITQVKLRLAEGLYLPTNLAERYALAIEEKPLTLSVSPIDGIVFKWSITPDGADAITDSTSDFTWTPAKGLSGKSAAVQVEAYKNNTRLEARAWNLKVLSGSSQGRLLKYTVRSDSTSFFGTSTRISQSDSLILRLTYNSLEPAPRDSVMQLDSVQIDYQRRPVLIRTWRPGGETIDSGFSWSTEGNLIALSVRQGSSIRVDSFSYSQGNLYETRHYVNDSLTERMVHFREGATGIDTLFVRANSGAWDISRIFRSRFLGNSLAEKTWFLQRDSAIAYRRETFVYTGLGSLLRYRFYTEGEVSELRSSQTWSYDGNGLSKRMVEKDETLNQTLTVIDFTWESSGGLPKATAQSSFEKWIRSVLPVTQSGVDLLIMNRIRTEKVKTP